MIQIRIKQFITEIKPFYTVIEYLLYIYEAKLFLGK